MAKIDLFLSEIGRLNASDLHLTSGFKPFFRLHGDMQRFEQFEVLTNEANKAILFEIMPPLNKREFEDRADTDFAYELKGVGRFRVNVFMDRYGIGGVLRLIPSKIPTADDLGLPKAVRDFCMMSKGLVLVTGPTGSGKSTTLAAMVDLINRIRSEHIITIEDPIEFVHDPQKCLINQREVHTHTMSFPNALRAALREDPDIVLVGEMRDLETIEIAIETAETGHLVFGTLHTNTAYTTVDRVIDKFPADRQNQIRTMLSDALKGVVAQTLCKKKGGGRVAAMEILVATTAISANIREGKTHMIPSAMQIGKNVGMQLFNDSFIDLVNRGVVEPREAYLKAIDKEGLLRKFEEHRVPFDPSEISAGGTQRATPKQLEHMIAQAQQALQRDPNSLDALNNLAWIMSTTVHERYRNGREAVRLAERAYQLTQGNNATILDTLSAAYAEVGQFDRAIQAARRALEIATTNKDKALTDSLPQLLQLYQAGKPVRD